MNPDEYYAAKMKEIAERWRHDKEAAHAKADDLLVSILKGQYPSTCDEIEKWYA